MATDRERKKGRFQKDVKSVIKEQFTGALNQPVNNIGMDL